MTEEEVLRGGVANAGAVRRVGDIVLRPANDHSATHPRAAAAMCGSRASTECPSRSPLIPMATSD